ncbi:MAG: hypothetical protein MZV64_05190 [Ignavibacteriales bacterium]|nr:hypothetical protein [Ignavibacteriales bacterium]
MVRGYNYVTGCCRRRWRRRFGRPANSTWRQCHGQCQRRRWRQCLARIQQQRCRQARPGRRRQRRVHCLLAGKCSALSPTLTGGLNGKSTNESDYGAGASSGGLYAYQAPSIPGAQPAYPLPAVTEHHQVDNHSGGQRLRHGYLYYNRHRTTVLSQASGVKHLRYPPRFACPFHQCLGSADVNLYSRCLRNQNLNHRSGRRIFHAGLVALGYKRRLPA